jgi:hypothetical protein
VKKKIGWSGLQVTDDFELRWLGILFLSHLDIKLHSSFQNYTFLSTLLKFQKLRFLFFFLCLLAIKVNLLLGGKKKATKIVSQSLPIFNTFHSMFFFFFCNDQK